MQASALAVFIGAPFAVAIGGLAVVAFALGPALMNSKLRNLGDHLQPVDVIATTGGQSRSPSTSTADN